MRIAKAEQELTYEKHFDVVLVNENLQVAIKEVEQLVADFLSSK